MTKEEKIKEYKKQWRLANKEKIKKYAKEYRKKNKEKESEYQKQYRLDNKESIREKQKQYYLDNKERLLQKSKQYRLDNKEKISEYRKKNKERKRKYDSLYFNKRYHTEPLYKLKNNLRSRTRIAFKRNSWRKGGTQKLLGCDWETAMKHIESQFESWMNWDNHGEWHIDHIVPLASATTKEEMEKLCHYTNLQPLLAEENISKGGNIYD